MASLIVYDHYFKTVTVLQSSPASYFEVAERSPINDVLHQKSTAFVPDNFIEAANKSKAAVVFVRAYEKVGDNLYKKEYKVEKGSGVIISENGYIVTNWHVIANADYVEITLEDKREFIAETISIDETTDIALLKIEALQLPALEFVDSDALQVGEWVLAVGNPFGLQSTVTAGIVSAKARNIDVQNKNDLESLIQSDAVINPGSSGGALVSTDGGLVGICTALLTKSGNYEGFSFAIPSNLVRKVVVDLKEYGAVQRGKLGISIHEVDADVANVNDLPFIKGVMINAINLNSAAADAGLRKTDVITKIQGKNINSASQFYEAINEHRPGDRIEVSYFRKGKYQKTMITLRNYLNTTDYITVRNDKILRDLGLEVRDLNSIEKTRIESDGVMVISVSKGSPIAKTKMQPRYIIEYFNDIKISNATEFVELLKKAKGPIELKGFYERYPGVFPYTFEL